MDDGIRRHATVTSTQDVLRDLARGGAPGGTAVVADAQSAGRGSNGRTWESPAGMGLYASVLVRPAPAAPDRLAALPLRVGAAVADALAGAVRVKWPNDLVAPDGRKVGGVLVEAEASGGAVAFVLVGVGLNVRSALLPASLRGSAAALDELVDEVPRDLAERVVAAVRTA
ncbi:MAG: biotin--[acetyl-CoA-carboxylase] ligase [Deltaproteobacteria bacterium]|nr:biotin--[acetyl-CoA-carboxylase] ligase [Deltaproteobacteria bacterium]